MRKTQNPTTGFTFKKVSAFKFNNQTYEVRYWKNVLCRISEILYQTNRSDFNQVLTLTGRNRPYFTKDESLLRRPKIIEGTDIYAETGLSANSIIKLCHNVIALFGYTKTDLKIFTE